MNTRNVCWLAVGMAVCMTVSSCRTCHDTQPLAGEKATEDRKVADENVLRKIRHIIIPEMSFRPPDTIVDAVEFFKRASRDYGDPEIPIEQRGLRFSLRLPPGPETSGGSHAPVIPALRTRNISLRGALALVCEMTGMKFRIADGVTTIVPAGAHEEDLIRKAYGQSVWTLLIAFEIISCPRKRRRRDELHDGSHDGGRRHGFARHQLNAGRQMGSCRVSDGQAEGSLATMPLGINRRGNRRRI